MMTTSIDLDEFRVNMKLVIKKISEGLFAMF